MVPLFSAVILAICCLIIPVTHAAPTNDKSHPNNVTLNPTDSPSPPEAIENSESDAEPYQPLTNTEKLSKLTVLVKTFNLQDCVGRVLCDLNCQPAKFGSDGKRALKMLVNIQTSGDMAKDEMHFYLNAAMTGRKAKFSHGDCHQCTDTYPSCLTTSKDIVDLTSLLRINH